MHNSLSNLSAIIIMKYLVIEAAYQQCVKLTDTRLFVKSCSAPAERLITSFYTQSYIYFNVVEFDFVDKVCRICQQFH